MSKKILVVDDEELIREALVDLLLGKGYEAYPSSSGNQAFTLTENESFDLVISDLRMDDGDGLELSRKLYDKFGESLPVIILTGYIDSAGSDLPSNVKEVVKKPIRFKKLIVQIEELLA
ncbi:response regulator [Halobacteriovorax sp. GB3]|uniref:response regulator n=1 Tax=Halobacteriovorax sp. GB3 TaxID=2719615 RepID=UPI002361E1F9|nr:response regulator [Halobacteriovorax sp. GB3]MDD0854864.1 response regulator [Halobacteriovorax sp. GB3]